MYVDDGDFLIRCEDKQHALAAIQKITKKKLYCVNLEYRTAGTFKEAMSCWRWSVEEDDDGNVVCISFDGNIPGNDHLLLCAIAPFVRDQSSVELYCEDNGIWQWNFQNQAVERTYKKRGW